MNDKGESLNNLDSDLGIGEVAVGDWRINRAEIEK